MKYEVSRADISVQLDWRALLGVDAPAHKWAKTLLYVFPPVTLIPPTLIRERGKGPDQTTGSIMGPPEGTGCSLLFPFLN